MHTNNTLKTHIGYWLNRLRSCVHQSFEARLAKYDISVASWCILVAIYDQKANSIHSLADYIEVDKATISRVVEKLTLKNMLIHKSGKDRRSGIIELTSESKDLILLLISEAEKNEKHYFGHLTSEEKLHLRNIMQKIMSPIPDIKLDGWLEIPLTQSHKEKK